MNLKKAVRAAIVDAWADYLATEHTDDREIVVNNRVIGYVNNNRTYFGKRASRIAGMNVLGLSRVCKPARDLRRFQVKESKRDRRAGYRVTLPG